MQYADAGNVATDAGPGCVGEQCLGPEDWARAERVFDAVSDALDTIDEACGLKCDVASVLIPGGVVLKASKVEKATKVRELGQFTIKTKTVPGRGPGQSRAEITVIRNAAGRVIRTFKDTFDRANRFMHRKPLRGGPEGRAP